MGFSCQDQTEDEVSKIAEEAVDKQLHTVENDSLFVPIEVARALALHLDEQGNFAPVDAENLRKKGKKAKKIKSQKAFKDRQNRDAFYLFNYEDDEGFSIIAADQRVAPVLAYNDEGQIELDTDNPGLAYWMSTLQDHVTATREETKEKDNSKNTNSRMAKGVLNQWRSITTSYNSNCGPMVRCDDGEDQDPGNYQPIQTWGPLIGTRWGQGCGYNDYAPWKSNDAYCNRAPAGCGPVAVAQVIYYYRNRFSSMSYNGELIDFNAMNLIPSPNNVQGNTPNIARLMRLIGNSIVII